MVGSEGNRWRLRLRLRRHQALMHRSLVLLAALAPWCTDSTRIVTMEGDALLSLSQARAGKESGSRGADLKAAATSGREARGMSAIAAAAEAALARPVPTHSKPPYHSKSNSTSSNNNNSSSSRSSSSSFTALLALPSSALSALAKAETRAASLVSAVLPTFAQLAEPKREELAESQPSQAKVQQALKSEFRDQAPEESCYRELSNYVVGCKASCRCAWSQQCYPHRIPFTDDAGIVEDVDVGLCSISVTLAVFTSFGILVLVIASIVATRMGLQWNLDEERAQHLKVVAKKAKTVKFGGVSSVPPKVEQTGQLDAIPEASTLQPQRSQ